MLNPDMIVRALQYFKLTLKVMSVNVAKFPGAEPADMIENRM